MYTIYIEGEGVEMTQGRIPTETVDLIYQSIQDEDTLESYFLFTEDAVAWFEIDDNFHAIGPLVNKCIVKIFNSAGESIYESHCNIVKTQETEVEEILPNDVSPFGSYKVLTCTDLFQGRVLTGTIPTKDFRLSLLTFEVESLNETKVITSIKYNGEEIRDIEINSEHQKHFKADIAE